ncbi:4-hydroxybenzoate 3-monooxygenase [Kibdelosporangium philippinense]|uniref:4-hydroxybenzoate 3-monooxygenase n=1 Tax=Kibdelosporangium philippinense TaxID=211113 RepID=A0ABS8ZKG8_9PSEU|nr:4-hydroxybenzoate 3-monooxygenase [Kibdelosporangium philippinense]MCE7006282.1 4-hydroxybenzoate 3-monooxygenase [Kibdelosporangium philippinense]
MSRLTADVLICGAGPAGLVLGNMLRADGIRCLIVERQSRAHVEQRARAGFLAENSVRILTENGLAEGLHANGKRHDTCAFRGDHGEFELKYSELGRGEVHTVYPQQDLVRDLIAQFIDRGGEIRFDTTVVKVDPHDAVLVLDDGTTLSGRFVAGCDGQHGVSRQAVPAKVLQRDHGVTWLALLAEAPPSMAAVTYAIHPNGFAGHMARTQKITRYYLQVPQGTDATTWSDEKVWAELHTRLRAHQYGSLKTGMIIERRVVDMTSHVLEPIQHGCVFLAGDSASLISPSAAKGANLALMAAEVLAKALARQINSGDSQRLTHYSAAVLPRIWRAQEFSHWMINLLHSPAGDDGHALFMRSLQRARLESLRDNRAHQDYFAENYIGI